MEVDDLVQELRADPYYLPQPALNRTVSDPWHGSLCDYNHIKKAFGGYDSGATLEYYERKVPEQPQQQTYQHPTPGFYKSLFAQTPLQIPQDNSATKPETVKISRSSTTKENFVKTLWENF